MKRFLKVFLGVFSVFVIVAGTTNYDNLGLSGWLTTGGSITAGTTITAGTGGFTSDQYVLGKGASVDSLGRVVMNVRNKSGAALVLGRVVAFDTTSILYDAFASDESPFTDTLGLVASEGGPVSLSLVLAGTGTNDTIVVYGSAVTGVNTIASTAETFGSGTATGDIRWSDYLWTTIDSITVDTVAGAANGIDSVRAYILSSKGVVLGTASSAMICGVVTSTTFADNAVGEIAISGDVKVYTQTGSGTYIKSGWPIIAGASGTGLPLAAASMILDSIPAQGHKQIGFGLGAKDDVSDTAAIWMYLQIK